MPRNGETRGMGGKDSRSADWVARGPRREGVSGAEYIRIYAPALHAGRSGAPGPRSPTPSPIDRRFRALGPFSAPRGRHIGRPCARPAPPGTSHARSQPIHRRNGAQTSSEARPGRYIGGIRASGPGWPTCRHNRAHDLPSTRCAWLPHLGSGVMRRALQQLPAQAPAALPRSPAQRWHSAAADVARRASTPSPRPPGRRHANPSAAATR